VVRQRIANPLHVGSNPILTSAVSSRAWFEQASLPWAGALCAIVACGGNAFQTATGTGAGQGSEGGVGGVADAGGVAEASMPGADGSVDGGGASFCAGRLELFCEDFDEYPNVGALQGSATWPGFEHVNGSFQFDTTGAPSPPNALDVQGDDGAQVLIVKTFPPRTAAPKMVDLTFDLRINDPGKPGLYSAAGFAAIAFGNTLDSGYVAMAIASSVGAPVLTALWSRASGAASPDAGSFDIATATGSFPTTGSWDGDYTLELTFTATASNPAGGPCLQVYRSINPLLARCLPLPPEFKAPSVFSIALGDEAGGFARTGSIDVEFDDVRFDVK
jgi:hypothetical protein